MTSDLFPYLIPYFLSLGLAIMVVLIAWHRRTVPGAKAYAIYALGGVIWILGYILELINFTVEGKGFWDDFQWIGMIIISITFPLFALRYSQPDFNPSSKNLLYSRILFSVVPLLFLFLLTTNGYHGLVRGESWLIDSDPFPILMYSFSPLVWFYVLYTYVIMIFGVVILLRGYLDSPLIYRNQIGLICIGVLIPLAGSILSLSGISFSEQRDIAPLTFAIGNVFIGLSLWRYGMLNLVPIARNTVVDSMEDLVIVLDPSGRIVDINPAAVALSRNSQEKLIGKSIREALPQFQRLLDQTSHLDNGGFELQAEHSYYDVIVKPIYDYQNQLMARIFVAHNVSHHKELEDELLGLNAALEERVRERTQQLAEAYDTTLEGWAKALELRDQETEGHSRRVTELTVCLAQKMGINGSKIEHIRRGALLHDIGKMGVPDRILRKQGSLTEAEFAIVQQHPRIAYELLASIAFLDPALKIPYYHHEWWNGEGYPEGLKGEEIPLEARIFAVIDHWDALSSDRPYRNRWPTERIIAYLRENAGIIFDPQVVSVFLDTIASGEWCV
jgi:putative nucleotidyltransferase with HDIG domain/PAS domain S-box-containing protein